MDRMTRAAEPKQATDGAALDGIVDTVRQWHLARQERCPCRICEQAFEKTGAAAVTIADVKGSPCVTPAPVDCHLAYFKTAKQRFRKPHARKLNKQAFLRHLSFAVGNMDAQAAARYRRSTRLQIVPFPAKIEALPHIIKAIDILLMSPAEVIVEAARTGDQKWLRSLLDEYGHTVLKEAVVAAAQDGHTAAVKLLMAEIIVVQTGSLNYESWRILTDAAMAAGGRGHLAVVQILLDQMEAENEKSDEGCSEFSYDASWKVMDAAAASRQLQVVRLAAVYAREEFGVRASDQCQALRLAISGGFTEIVNFLLEPSRFSWSHAEALDQAILEGQREIADLIYAKCSPTYAEGKSFFSCLADEGDLKAVTYLYNSGQVSVELVDEALVSSAQTGCVDVASFLLDTGSVSAKAFNSAFELAAAHGAIDTVKLLYGQGRVSTNSVITAFKSTSSVAVVKFLHENERVPAEIITTAFENASCCGWRKGRYYRCTEETDEIAKYLSGEPCIPAEVVNEAFEKAADKGGITMIEALYGDRIFPEVTTSVLISAVATGSIDVVRLLCQSPGLPFSAKHEALLMAARCNQRGVAQYMASSENWPVDVLNEALHATTHRKLKRYLRTSFHLE
jgi:hypothetical protein